LNAQQVAGVSPERELPVVWAVAKGSMKNKAILVPAALAISALAPWAVVPLLMIGGAYLCFEGFEKVAHKLLHSAEEDAAHRRELAAALVDPEADLVTLEKDKIRGAIRTDFILSAEIIVIALGTVATASFAKQVAVLVGIALVMTVGVYGLVAGIVKLDDLGVYLERKRGAARSVGRGILWLAPSLMKSLSVIGTAAMFLVGGAILLHGIGPLHHWVEGWTPALSGPGAWVVGVLADGITGVLAGALVLGLVSLWRRLRQRTAPSQTPSG
jgi:predicted DNA repair protein MutK